MELPYGIDEQYMYIYDFLDKPSKTNILHIENPYYETPAILTIVIQTWEKKNRSESIHIRYIESDTFIKRIITNKKTNIVKTIILENQYNSGWVWKEYPTHNFTTIIRPEM